MRQIQSIILTTLLLATTPSLATEPVTPRPTTIIEKLLTTLPGPWTGQATHTPVGPVDYNLSFHRCNDSLVAGIAQLNVSDHHWQFHRIDDELQLTFLSTFGGNTEPVKLAVSGIDNNTIHFHAPRLALLTLAVSVHEQALDIAVFHHREPHVQIRLTSSEEAQANAGQVDVGHRSCAKMGGKR